MNITFNIAKAKTPFNPKGMEVITRNGKKVELQKKLQPVLKYQEILFPIIGKIDGITYCWQKDGKFGIDNDKESNFDLMLEDKK